MLKYINRRVLPGFVLVPYSSEKSKQILEDKFAMVKDFLICDFKVLFVFLGL